MRAKRTHGGLADPGALKELGALGGDAGSNLVVGHVCWWRLESGVSGLVADKTRGSR